MSLPMVSLRDSMELSMKEAGVQEILQNTGAVGRMVDLRVELDAPGLLTFYMICGVDHIVCGGYDLRAFGETGDGVAVGHPYLRVIWNPFKQGALSLYMHDGAAVLTGYGGIDLPAVAVGDVLSTVADAEHREAALDAGKIGRGGLRVADRPRTAREDHAADTLVEGWYPVEWMDFAVNVQLPEPAADKLGDLGTEVEDDDFLRHIVG